MFIKIRRLFCKPFGSRGNLLSFTLLVLILYLMIRTYIVNNYEEPNDDIAHFKESQNEEFNNKPPVQVAKIFDKECEIDETCLDGTIPYKVVSGEGYDKYPLMCFNGKLIMSKSLPFNKISRGINLVVIKQTNNTFEVDKIENFDTFAEDAGFFRFIKTGTNDGDIILLASYDEMANGLKEVTLNIMERYGSQLFRTIKFRDSFVMIGQRGVSKGKAIEIVEPKKNRDFAPQAKISGCLKLPLGQLTPFPQEDIQVNSKHQILVGHSLKYCGLPEPCPKDEFAVHIYTGENQNDEPKICVDGKYIIAKGLNDAGRGLNIVVVGNGKEILKTAHFDTYQDDSTNLEIFLENLYDNVIVIICTFDEASAKLGVLAKNLLYDLGSALVQNLKHRDAWYLIGQKGINGFSPNEEISYAGPDNSYPKPLNKRFCVPQTLKGMKIRPDPLPRMNDKRRDFCSRYDGYADFCFEENIDKPVKPVPLINKTLEDHPIYSTPILVIGGISHNSLRMSLETIVMQPGINPEMVYVALDEKLDETSALVQLFEFNLIKTSSSNRYIEQMNKAIEDLFAEPNQKDKKAIIIIEEELLVSPDFLYYFTQLYEMFMNDPSLAAISAWNPNGYLELDGCPHTVYRTNDFPGLGFLLKRSVYEDLLKSKFDSCCQERAWNNWLLSDTSLETLMPDVSRVYHRPYNGIHKDSLYLENLFNRLRKTNLLPFPEIKNLSSLASRRKYKKFLLKKLKESIEFPEIEMCFKNRAIQMPKTARNIYKIVYKQDSIDDYENLKHLCKCFQLFYDETLKPKGMYDGIIRFHARRNDFVLIGSMNPLLSQIE